MEAINVNFNENMTPVIDFVEKTKEGTYTEGYPIPQFEKIENMRMEQDTDACMLYGLSY